MILKPIFSWNLLLGLALTSLNLESLILPTQASSDPTWIASAQRKPGRGVAGGRRQGGGGLDRCPNPAPPLTAIVPATEINTNGRIREEVGGVTTTERPTLWFYIPYRLGDTLTATFVLQDQDEREIYTTPVKASAAQFVSIQLPELETAKLYAWTLKIRCDGQDAAPMYVRGGIERVPLDANLAQQLNQATSIPAKLALYQQAELWYDAIAFLGDPSDPKSAENWQNLFQALNLKGLTSIQSKPVSN